MSSIRATFLGRQLRRISQRAFVAGKLLTKKNSNVWNSFHMLVVIMYSKRIKGVISQWPFLLHHGASQKSTDSWNRQRRLVTRGRCDSAHSQSRRDRQMWPECNNVGPADSSRLPRMPSRAARGSSQRVMRADPLESAPQRRSVYLILDGTEQDSWSGYPGTDTTRAESCV